MNRITAGLLLALAVSAAKAQPPRVIDQCGVTLTESGTYVVNQMLAGASLGACITIAGSNVTLVGTNGGGINGAFQNAAVLVLPGGYTDIAISNLNLTNTANSGILVNASNYSLGTAFSDRVSVTGNTITSGDEGIWILGCTGCWIDGNTVTPYSGAVVEADSGMVIDGTSDVVISNNTVSPGYRTAAIEFVDLNTRATVSRNHLAAAVFAGAIGTVHNGDLVQSRISHNQITGTTFGIYWAHIGGVSKLNGYLNDTGIEFYQNSIVDNVIGTPYCVFMPYLYSSLEYPMWSGTVEDGATTPEYARVSGNRIVDNVCSANSVVNFGDMADFVAGRMYGVAPGPQPGRRITR